MNPGCRGLTLVELLVALTIMGIVMTSIVNMFVSMSAGYTAQNGVADLQQSIRAVMGLMVQEIRMAGFSSVSDDRFGITEAAQGAFGFTVDWDNDGLVTASHSDDDLVLQESDIIDYLWDREQKRLLRRTAAGTASASTQALLGGNEDLMDITDLAFSYFDQAGNETGIAGDIRSVGVAVTAQTPAGRKGMVQRTYETRITCRNLGS